MMRIAPGSSPFHLLPVWCREFAHHSCRCVIVCLSVYVSVTIQWITRSLQSLTLCCVVCVVLCCAHFPCHIVRCRRIMVLGCRLCCLALSSLPPRCCVHFMAGHGVTWPMSLSAAQCIRSEAVVCFRCCCPSRFESWFLRPSNFSAFIQGGCKV